MSILDPLKDEIASVWTLLAETSLFLERALLWNDYEKMIRDWRRQLQNFSKDQEKTRRIKSQIIELRSHLRQAGHNLALGRQDVLLGGMLHDDARAEGFRRLVLLLGKSELHFLTGESNHLELASLLGRRLGLAELESYPNVHFLWYRWQQKGLELHGAASEPAAHWESFRAWAKERKGLLLKRLKGC